MTYAQTCTLLGFDAASKFVKITRNGAIDFTAGKPEEIRALAVAATRHGFKLSTKFQRFIRQQGWTLPQAETWHGYMIIPAELCENAKKGGTVYADVVGDARIV